MYNVFRHSAINNKVTVDNISVCNQMQDNPRLIKSHLPSQLLPRQIWEQKRKIIYVARNPKDVVISSFHFLTGLGLWQGNLDDFVDQFITDRIMFTSYWLHTIDFYRMRNEPNVFFVTFEEMKRGLKDVIERLSLFLDCKVLSEAGKEMLIKHLSFENMKGKHSFHMIQFYNKILLESQSTNPTTLIRKAFNAKEDFE